MTALLVGLSTALAPPPDYRSELGQRLAADVRRVAEAEGLDAAISLAAAIEDDVGALVDVRYEAALARNRAGRIEPAIAAYTRVLELDPDHIGALYDRGELWLVDGQPENRARAHADLEHAQRLRPDHWAVHYRLAQLAGQEGDFRKMEQTLVQSVQNGLAVGLLLEDPAWQTLFADPDAGPVLTRIVRIYGDHRDQERLPHAP